MDAAASRFSAILVNYNGGAMLAEAAGSCVETGIAAADCIVVDNGSRDGSLEECRERFPGITAIRNACNAGFARAVNQGLRLARKEFVLLLNTDARLRLGALDGFASAFDAHPAMAIAGARLLHPDGRLQNSIAPLPRWWQELVPMSLLKILAPRRFAGKLPDAQRPVAVESVIGAALALRRAALEKLGPLDERFFFFLEETDWCQRAWAQGFEVQHVPGAEVVHGQGQTAARFHGAARIEYQRSKLLYYAKAQGALAAAAVGLVLPVKALVDSLANGFLVLVTLGLARRQRQRFGSYASILAWHLLGRPASWGLPDKCADVAGPDARQ